MFLCGRGSFRKRFGSMMKNPSACGPGSASCRHRSPYSQSPMLCEHEARRMPCSGEPVSARRKSAADQFESVNVMPVAIFQPDDQLPPDAVNC
jgi:hypothetical protein